MYLMLNIQRCNWTQQQCFPVFGTFVYLRNWKEEIAANVSGKLYFMYGIEHCMRVGI